MGLLIVFTYCISLDYSSKGSEQMFLLLMWYSFVMLQSWWSALNML